MDETSDPVWISACDAIDLMLTVYGQGRQLMASMSLSKRAHGGLLRTRARLVQWEEEDQSRGGGHKVTKEAAWESLPAKFWWADGKDAYSQNWIVGDFITSIGRKYRWAAFGVEFCKQDIEEMLPARDKASVARADNLEQQLSEDPPSIAGPLPSDEAIAAKMQELVELGMNRDVAAKVIRQVAGFEQVGNEHARRCVAGTLPRGRPKNRVIRDG